MKTRKVPRGTFWIGASCALGLGLPLLSFGFKLLADAAHIGEPGLAVERAFVIAAIFAGLPAFLSGGGVARLCAHRLAERALAGRSATVRHALVTGALAMGLAGIGLAYLTAVPLGGMPEEPARWVPIGVVGLCCGALTGLAIGLLAGMRVLRQHSGEVRA